VAARLLCNSLRAIADSPGGVSDAAIFADSGSSGGKITV
jgi:hypothetical protein